MHTQQFRLKSHFLKSRTPCCVSANPRNILQRLTTENQWLVAHTGNLASSSTILSTTETGRGGPYVRGTWGYWLRSSGRKLETRWKWRYWIWRHIRSPSYFRESVLQATTVARAWKTWTVDIFARLWRMYTYNTFYLWHKIRKEVETFYVEVS